MKYEIRRYLLAPAAGMSAVALSGLAQAQSILPADVATTFTDAKADIVTVIGLAMTLVLAIVAWRYVRRAAS